MTREETQRYADLISRFSRARVVVAGDLIADEFLYGQVERVSREAPVLILKYDTTEVLPGGAGNAANNVVALGARVKVVGAVGRDDAGRRLLEAMPSRANTRGVARVRGYVTPVKTRVLAGGVHSAKQQVVRIDRAGQVMSARQRAAVVRRLEDALAAALANADVVIVSDYGSGLYTPELIARAEAKAAGRGDRLRAGAKGAVDPAYVGRVPMILVDSRYGLAGFRGVTACTPNEPEVEALLGVSIGDDPAALEKAGRTLLRKLQSRAVLITRGSRGMALFEPGRPTDHIPIVGSDQIADVTGAGDTVIATFGLALASGATFGEAARLANHAGGLVVMKRGTATVSAAELLAATC
ncbi:MAG TPA: PfkB family carbohydrate kinase [Vicinamibacterales bacterium]|nr:PfkB family carbohydrate kinase [Vicinamibacterales bacterium]